MAAFLKRTKRFFTHTPLGNFLRAVFLAAVYAAMAALICMYFSGNGAFIYEGF